MRPTAEVVRRVFMENRTSWKTRIAAGLALAAAATVLLAPARANAHAIGLSTGEYTLKADGVHAKLAFARGEVASLAPNLDANHDGHVTAIEVEEAKKELESKVIARIDVRAGDTPCTPVLTSAALTEADGLLVDGRFSCAKQGAAVNVDVKLLDDLSHGHRHVARGVGAATQDEVLYRGHSTFTIAPPAGTATAEGPAAAPAPAAPASVSAWSFFKMGIEHILTGYDHLVFLAGLVLLRSRLREILAVVTAFTLAHSITLGIAALGIFTPSPKFVEPAIALSIAYVGIENFFVKDGSKRWRITFPFGLIHGFGFAGALAEVNLSRAQVPTALVSFNLGVEAGQLFVLGLILPMIHLARQQDWFEPKGVRILSGAVAAAGCVWFVARVVSGG
ncbi:MAG: HupE/UreJ family protein [Deltaproteobacteria bacterium]|nr:HupE/UreJ family protein [Deltaproteobacteria bacterium]